MLNTDSWEKAKKCENQRIQFLVLWFLPGILFYKPKYWILKIGL